MPKVALYARYSTDNQSVVSIEDQFRICREHADRERWQVVDTYHDAAISGASVILRPGVQSLLQDARSLIGEVVITPGEKRGENHATLRGELMAVLDLAAGRRRLPRPEVITNALACPRFEPTIRQVSEFRRTIGGNIADLCRVGKSGSALPLPIK